MSLPKGTKTHYLEETKMKKIEVFEKVIEPFQNSGEAIKWCFDLIDGRKW